jgi:uncharacterized protein (DUF2141 family)
MLRNVALITLAFSFAMSFGQATLSVSVVLNKPEAGGMLRIALAPNENAYDTAEGCTVLSVPASGRVVTATFEDVQPGTCAVKVFHDINADNELNTSWIGWPKEPYGFSNDAPVNMGPPPYKLAMTTLRSGSNSMRVALR